MTIKLSKSAARRQRARRKADFERCYESHERVEWVQREPCVVPGCTNVPCQNVHIQIDGMGRKAASTFIVPGCAQHHDLLGNQLGRRKFEALYHVDLAAEAIDTELRWRQYVAAQQEHAF